MLKKIYYMKRQYMYLILIVLLYIICINNEFKFIEDNEDKIVNIKIVYKNLFSVLY